MKESTVNSRYSILERKGGGGEGKRIMKDNFNRNCSEGIGEKGSRKQKSYVRFY